jgi:hypothetical protein
MSDADYQEDVFVWLRPANEGSLAARLLVRIINTGMVSNVLPYEIK